MAQVPYDQGIQSVTPDVRLPDDYEHSSASPNAFGAQIGQGMQSFGAGATKAGVFFGQVTADHAANDFQDFTDKLLHGDPTKQALGPDGKPQIGPDGQPMLDTGFLGLKGEAATKAWPAVHQAITDKMTDLRGNLTTMEQMQQFDQFSKRYRASAFSQVGSHADTQYLNWYTEVNKASEINAINHISNNADNPDEVAHGTSDLINARVKQLQLQGITSGPVYDETIAAGKQSGLKAQLEAISVHSPDKAMEILEKNRTLAGTLYEPLAQQFRARATDVGGTVAANGAIARANAAMSGGAAPAPGAGGFTVAGVRSGAGRPTPSATNANGDAGAPPAAAAPGPTVPVGGVADPAAVIRHFEGYKDRAYRDNDGRYRVGYGSDTVTNPDGSTSPVTAFTTTDRAGAERDLSRRAANSQGQVQAAAGPAWNSLTPQARASLTSIAYNYGRVPDRLLPAIRSGDSTQIATAIHNLGGDNGGINASRRSVEASNVMGRFGLSGVETMRGLAPTMTMPTGANGGTYDPHPILQAMASDYKPDAPPAWNGAPPSQGSFAPPTPQGTPAAVAPPTGSPPPANQPPPILPPPAQAVPPDPLMVKAAAFQDIESQVNAGKLTPEAAERAYTHISRSIQNTMIAQEADAKSKADLSEKAANSYFTDISNGHFEGKHDQIVNDPRLKYQTKEAMLNVLERATGERSIKGYGPGYTDAFNRIFLPEGDPNKITNTDDILKMGGPGGPLTPNGASKLYETMGKVRRNADDAAVKHVTASQLSYVQDIFKHPQPPIFPGAPERVNTAGKEKFESEFVPRFEASMDQYLRGGGDPWSEKSPSAKKNVDAMMEQVWPKRLRDKAFLQDSDEGKAQADAQKELVIPPAPPKADQAAWTSLVTKPPPLNSGVPMSRADWAPIVANLAAHPTPQNIAAWNASRFGRAGYDAEHVLAQLYPQALKPAPPSNPEDVLPERDQNLP